MLGFQTSESAYKYMYISDVLNKIKKLNLSLKMRDKVLEKLARIEYQFK